ncbi:hypothetical protein [Caldalkalibacillus mannanilyticus]|nr:hypothetical protein [Caldalkalibacillus mannanilyticus]
MNQEMTTRLQAGMILGQRYEIELILAREAWERSILPRIYA